MVPTEEPSALPTQPTESVLSVAPTDDEGRPFIAGWRGTNRLSSASSNPRVFAIKSAHSRGIPTPGFYSISLLRRAFWRISGPTKSLKSVPHCTSAVRAGTPPNFVPQRHSVSSTRLPLLAAITLIGKILYEFLKKCARSGRESFGVDVRIEGSNKRFIETFVSDFKKARDI